LVFRSVVVIVTAREFEQMGDDGNPVIVRFDYAPGEPEWFNAAQGVGHPGCDPMVQITEVNFGSGWVPAATLTEKERDAFEAQIVYVLEQIADEDKCDAETPAKEYE
jgi:hypothetical protein